MEKYSDKSKSTTYNKKWLGDPYPAKSGDSHSDPSVPSDWEVFPDDGKLLNSFRISCLKLAKREKNYKRMLRGRPSITLKFARVFNYPLNFPNESRKFKYRCSHCMKEITLIFTHDSDRWEKRKMALSGLIASLLAIQYLQKSPVFIFGYALLHFMIASALGFGYRVLRQPKIRTTDPFKHPVDVYESDI